MILLAIDTASTLCAACLHDSVADVELGRVVLDLGKGHAEHLTVVVDGAMRQAGLGFPDLGRIAVSVGPGSFTGVRVGVAAARGYALALGIPAIGVTTLEAIATQARIRAGERPVMVALDAGRGEINLAVYDVAGKVVHGPAAATLAQAAQLARDHGAYLAGSAAASVAREADLASRPSLTAATADIAIYARLGATKDIGGKPKPLYLRAADAKPQAGFVLPRIPS
ncbi:MAG: tRNA (adenosine(37)-N6)-threonylcarbamoyltransferase complex dimerization subunit type 1 TsaB [Hyphomicrobiales bacterium]|nr:tRNA (adenosine(37)-N6)-threonylcarbamoyltransferase complex dimerization subunit type 1 TsaB [Hyphomicrobiales bacterium]